MNPGLHNESRSAYEFAKLQRMPKWLTYAHRAEIKRIYCLAKELSWLSEGGLEVDHIVPLNGKNVSGLHVPWNLQIITRVENQAKINKFEVSYV